MDFNMALILIFFVSRRYRVVLVADGVLKDAAFRMGFEYVPDLKTAPEVEKKKMEKATVNIIPAGGYIFPIVKEGFRFIDA
jgi:hypothetical protein